MNKRTRSKNHLLLESFLEEKNESTIFDKVKGFSLSMVVLYTEIHNDIKDLTSLEIINLLRALDNKDSIQLIADSSDEYLDKLRVIRAMQEVLGISEAYVLEEVVQQINQWHIDKGN